MFLDRIIKIIFFDNSFIVKIYVQKTNFLKCHFFSIGDTAVADRLRDFSKCVLGRPFKGPTSQASLRGGSRELFWLYFQMKLHFSPRIWSFRDKSLERD